MRKLFFFLVLFFASYHLSEGAAECSCQMEQVCGSSSGWTRVAYLNMSNPTEEYPGGFRLYNQNGVRACGRLVTSGGSCLSVRFPSYSISYSQVCGRVYGYQKGTPDAFWRNGNSHMNVNGNYWMASALLEVVSISICGHMRLELC